MKRTFLTLGILISAGTIVAQEGITPTVSVTTNALGQEVMTATPSSFKITPKVTELPPLTFDPTEEAKEVEDGRREFYMEGYEEALAKGKNTIDPIVQTEMGTRTSRSPIENFNGFGGPYRPNDPSGAAGPDHYVQAINTSVRIYTKTGSVVPGATFSLASFWPGSSNEGDPIVMYDRHAERWFISQFQQSPNQILIAISETSDPTGAYYAYSFNLSNFPDYPKYSIWWDGYYMTSNSSHTAVAFEREKMLAGDPSAQMISLSLPGVGGFGFKSPLPADADGDLPPAGTPCYFFNLDDGASQDFIDIFEMTCDWNNTGASQVVSSQSLSVASFNGTFSGGWSNIAQPGTNQGLDAIMGVFMYRAQHMRWSGYNTMMLSHAVNLGSNRSGVRWYELRDANDGNWSVYQSGTYAPDATTSRWMSSIAMDTWGNIGMGYSISNGTNVYPGLAYTGRLSSDAPGDMSYGEQVAISGSSSQTGIDRWGDYAHLSLDPDGKTFWHTGEYMSATGPKTRIFSFSIYDEAGIHDPYYSDLSLTLFQNEGSVEVTAAGIHNNESVEISLIGMNGKTIYQANNISPLEGSLNHSIDINSLGTGVYFVRIGNPNFQKVERVYLQQ